MKPRGRAVAEPILSVRRSASASASARRCARSASIVAGRAGRGGRPERRRQDDASVDPRRRPAAERRQRQPAAPRGGARDRLGAAEPALYSKLSVEENLRLFARLEQLADPEAAVARDARAHWPRERAREPRRAPVRRQSPARERRARVDRRPCRCSRSMSPPRRSTRASAPGCGSSSCARIGGRGTERAVLDPPSRRGPPLRHARDRARRRRAAVRRHAGAS